MVHLVWENELAWHNICWPHPVLGLWFTVHDLCANHQVSYKSAFWSVYVKDFCSTYVSYFERPQFSHFRYLQLCICGLSPLSCDPPFHLCVKFYCKHFMSLPIMLLLYSAFFLAFRTGQNKLAKNKACVLRLGCSDLFWICLNYWDLQCLGRVIFNMSVCSDSRTFLCI